LITLSTIQEAQKRKANAQKQLFERYADVIYRLAKRYVQEEMEAEDITIETFVISFEKLPMASFASIPQFEAWLKRIAINEALKILRKRVNFRMVSDTMAQNVPFDDQTIDNMTNNQILEVVMGLPTGYRTVFNLYAIEGYTHTEIADLLHISEGTSKSQLSKAKTMLQKRLIMLDKDYAERQFL
jgi:RNA polymerase sigma factor (sigma-70 family)